VNHSHIVVLAGASAAAAVGSYYFYGPGGKRHRKQLKGWSVKAKGEILQKVEKLNEVDARDYYALVDQVAKKYSSLKDVNTKEIADFKRELKKHWKIIEKGTRKTVKKGKRKIHKATAPKKKTKKRRVTKRTSRRKTSTRKKAAKRRR